jgi:SulP family sulfate permease
LPGIDVRRAEGTAAKLTRPRFAWNIGEVSGSLGDLGTFLPHIIGAITIVKMAPAGILTTFGLFYMASGAFYGVLLAVQPMKAASAAVLMEPMNPAVAFAGGLPLAYALKRRWVRM